MITCILFYFFCLFFCGELAAKFVFEENWSNPPLISIIAPDGNAVTLSDCIIHFDISEEITRFKTSSSTFQAFMFYYHDDSENEVLQIEEKLKKLKEERPNHILKVEDEYRDLSARSYGKYRYHEGPTIWEYKKTIKEHIPSFRGTPKIIVGIKVSKDSQCTEKAKKIAEENSCEFTTVDLDDFGSVNHCFEKLAKKCAKCDIFTENFVDPKKVGKRKD